MPPGKATRHELSHPLLMVVAVALSGPGWAGSVLSRTKTVAFVGTEARIVEVDVDVATSGLPGLTIVGLPDKSVREAEQRTRSALASTGVPWPSRRMVANLAPGTLRKEGTHFDLSIALGILAGVEHIDGTRIDGWVACGELALDGSLRPVRGTLAAALAARDGGHRGLICPRANAPEAALVKGLEIIPVTSLSECIEWLGGRLTPSPVASVELPTEPFEDVADVRGHASAKRAVEVAAAGGHNLLMIGPPGSGKTMLARRLPGVLPALTPDESLEVTRIHSVAGLLGERSGLIGTRPFRSPHHHVSLAGLIGGGSGLPRPGEASLAHLGVLFLDELSLYRKDALESLRAPLEDGVVRLARSAGVIAFPCRFSLVGAMNPCPCGYLGDARRACRCTRHQLELHRARLSGPLLDRIDIHVTMARLEQAELLGAPAAETSAEVRCRVEAARAVQCERYDSSVATNASVSRACFDATVALTDGARRLLRVAIESLGLSGRGVDRVVRMARTLADLAATATVDEDQVGEALAYRAPEGDPGMPS
jgi:magnesium chelatase family protein